MAKTLQAIFDGEVLRPEEAVELNPNTSYTVIIKQEESLKSRNMWSVLSNLAGKVEGPSDWSKEHDHYLYGTLNESKKN